nr:hypothetical protein [Ectobacillus antri]
MNRKPVHVAMFSGGAASAYVAYQMVQAHGKENCILFFTNTLWEDEDNYRFMNEVSEYIGLEITERIDGRTPEEVFYDYRFLGNSRMAKCSEELKVYQTIIFLEELRDVYNLEPILYFGIGPHETHRSDNLREFYKHRPIEPIETRFPMIDTFRADIDVKAIIENEWGIKLPRMYSIAKDLRPELGVKGFSHANCGGRCVRGGFQHYALLYSVWPHVYAEQEEMEENFRKHFEKNVSILKKDGGPYTLREYRKVLETEGVEKFLQKPDDTVPCVCSFS